MMKCPNCAHVSDTALLKCSACGEAYDRAALETLQHLEYVVDWLNAQAGESAAEARQLLSASAVQQLEAARRALNLPAPKPAVSPAPVPAQAVEPAPIIPIA